MTPAAGDVAWVLLSAALVMLMTPGLAFFYGGMVRSGSVLNMLISWRPPAAASLRPQECGNARRRDPEFASFRERIQEHELAHVLQLDHGREPMGRVASFPLCVSEVADEPEGPPRLRRRCWSWSSMPGSKQRPSVSSA